MGESVNVSPALVYCDLCGNSLAGESVPDDYLGLQAYAMSKLWLADVHVTICPRCRFEGRCRREKIRIARINHTTQGLHVELRNEKGNRAEFTGEGWGDVFRELVYSMTKPRIEVNSRVMPKIWVNIVHCGVQWINFYYDVPDFADKKYQIVMAGEDKDVLPIAEGVCDGKEHFMRVKGPGLSFSCSVAIQLKYYELEEA